MGVETISQIESSHVYELELADQNVSLYVAYDDGDELTMNVELVDGFEFLHGPFKTRYITPRSSSTPVDVF